MKRTRLGLIGFRAPGFYPCVFDELLIRRTFGVGIDHIPLSEVVFSLQSGAKRTAPTTDFPRIEGGNLPAESVDSIEHYYGALSSVLEKSGKNLFAIKDWPEIMGLEDPGGIWPGLGWLMDEGYLLAPEGDVNAAITMGVLRGLDRATHSLRISVPGMMKLLRWLYGIMVVHPAWPATRMKFVMVKKVVKFNSHSNPVGQPWCGSAITADNSGF